MSDQTWSSLLAACRELEGALRSAADELTGLRVRRHEQHNRLEDPIWQRDCRVEFARDVNSLAIQVLALASRAHGEVIERSTRLLARQNREVEA